MNNTISADINNVSDATNIQWSASGLSVSCSTCKATNIINNGATGVYSASVRFTSNGATITLNYALYYGGFTWYEDKDGDQYGNNNVTQKSCSQPTGYVSNNTDCDDNNAAINPNTVWYKDQDNDGYSDGNTQTRCTRPSGYKLASELTATSGDCNDSNASEKPGQVWYKDQDNDGYSDGSTLTQCTRPSGYKLASELTATSGDCNDSNASITLASVWYKDQDNDGYSDGNTQTRCNRPSGYKLASELTATSGDCNDNNASEKPGQVWYKDQDNDGYSDGTTLTQCNRPSGYKLTSELTSTSGDCNDNDKDLNPATVWYFDNDNDGYYSNYVTQCTKPTGPYKRTGILGGGDCNDADMDINPTTQWFLDADNDGYYTGNAVTQCTSPGAGYKRTGLIADGDCNDSDSSINPATVWYLDADNDGYYLSYVTQCTEPGPDYKRTGILGGGDCHDNNALEKPGQVWYLDKDNDKYAATNASTITQCIRPANYKAFSELLGITDCDDENSSVIALSTIAIGNNTPRCAGTIDLTTIFSTNGTLAFFSNSSFSSTVANPIASSGQYFAKATLGTCTNSASVSVTINPLPTISTKAISPQCGGTFNLSTAFETNAQLSFFTDNAFSSTVNSPVATSGVYFAKTADANSCSATASVSVTINTPATTSVSVPPTQCAGTIDLTNVFTSNGSISFFSDNAFSSTVANPIASSGQYFAKATLGTCTNSASVSITINALPVINVSTELTTICINESVSFQATQGLSSYSWSKSGGTFVSTENHPSISFSSGTAGIFTITVIASNGSCSNSAWTTIQVNSSFNLQTTSNAPLCPGNTLQLSVSLPNASYSWVGPGFSSSTQSPTRNNFTASMNGVYSITLVKNGGCSATSSISVKAKASPILKASSNSPLCSGNTLQLSASGGTSYAWSGATLQSSEQNPSLIVNNSSIGVYSVSVTNTDACTASTTLSVSVQAAALSVNPNPLNVCIGQTINLSTNASPAASAFSWKGPGNFSSTTQNISTYATTTANLGIYSVSATIGSCTVSTTAEVKSGAVLQAGVVGIPCVGGTIQFTASGMTSYTWSRTTNNFNSNLPNPVIPSSTMNDAGIYFLSARSGSCVASALVPVMLTGSGINPSFSVSPSTITAGATVALSAASASGVYSWSGPSGFSGNTRTKSISNFQAVNNGIYRLTLTVGTCTGYTEKNISINSATRLAAAEIEPMEMEINAYPNPVGKTLTVEVRLKEPSALQLNLVNSVGKPSGAWQLNEVTTFHKTELNLSDLQGGVYLLQAQADKQKVVKRVVKIQY